jgi:hypothetical protein
MQRTAESQIKLATGGSAGSSQMNLWVLQGTATKYNLPWANSGGDWFHSLTSTPIPAQNISIYGQTLDANYNAYVLLPGNTNVDITPIIENDNPNNYTYDVTPQEYTLTHTTECTAVGNPDNTRTTIGIGEVVNFGGWPSGTTWSVSGQGRISSTSGSGTVFTAAMGPGSATVTATIANVNIQTELSIVAPSSVAVIGYADQYAAYNRVGTLMAAETTFTNVLNPTTVSFNNVSFRENPEPSSMVITWPNQTVMTITFLRSAFTFPCGDDRQADDIHPTPYSTSLLVGATTDTYSISNSWTWQYLNDVGAWTDCCQISRKLEFNVSNGQERIIYCGKPGGWQGPF